MRAITTMFAWVAIGGLAAGIAVFGQEPAANGRGGPGRGGGGRQAPPSIVMKVEWHAIAGMTGARPGVPDQVPVVQGHVVDPNVELKQYGAAAKLLTANGDPSSVWSG